MMDISHLYHDAAFGDPSLELDVKEQLKTREVNAREERNLQRVHQSYERAKCICEKNTAWERWKVGQSLTGIWERSPRLEKRLAVEKARIEALERSILYRNYRMASNMSNVSFNSRGLSSVSLEPLQDKRNKRQKRKDRKKNDEDENKINSNVNPERGFLRQADFVRRSEHSIKALAKLNWKQQTRRRDHEKFKEELFFHSKPVIEKAKVVLKGRQDIDVDTLSSDFENILLPPVKRPANMNNSFRPFIKHQGPSTLPEKNVLIVDDSPDRKSYASDLFPVAENLEAEEKETTQNNEKTPTLRRASDKENDSVSEGVVSPNTQNGGISNSDRLTLHSNAESIDDTAIPGNVHLPPLSHNTTLTKDSNFISKTIESQPGKDSSVSDGSRNSNPSDDVMNTDQSASPLHHDQTHPQGPFSPSTSISQVIIEEEEEEEGINKESFNNINTHSIEGEAPTDFNNNTMNQKESDADVNKAPSLYTLACTVGLPKLWKQATKTKEKPPVEVSVAALGRKHRKKRKERW